MEVTKNLKIFFKQDLNSLVAHSGRHKRDLVAERVDQLTTLDKVIASKEITYAENVTWCVGKAIQAYSDKSRKILTDDLLGCLNKTVMKETNFSKSRYFELKHIAIDEFIENFVAYQKKIGLDPYIKLVK